MKLLYNCYILFLAFVFSFITIQWYTPINANHTVPRGNAADPLLSAVVPLPFDDIAGSYAKNQIVDLYKQQIVSGIGDRIFAPERSISRAEFAAMLLRVLNLQPLRSEIPAFTDVAPASWYSGPVHALLNLGIVSGTAPHAYDPAKSITRQEAAVILTRALKQLTVEVDPELLPFSDARQISPWALPHVDAAERMGMMGGFAGKFRPLDPISRQEAAVVFDRILKNTDWAAQLTQKPEPGIQLGWMYNQTAEEFKQSVQASMINTISPRWFFLKAPDQITNTADLSLVAWAHENQKQVWPLVGNRFDQELTHKFLTQEDLRMQLVAQLASYVEKYQLDGLNIDFENVAPADKGAFTLFIMELATALDETGTGAELSVCVPPNSGTDWDAAYDYEALGAIADYVVLMGYDEHWVGGPNAGSVSSLPWLENHVEKLVQYFPGDKLIVGLPLYTRDWYKNGGQTASSDLLLPEQNALYDSLLPKLEWNAKVGQYIAAYNKGGVQHQIWMEESRSLSLKYQAGSKYGAAGYAYWHVGGGTEEVWTSLSNAKKYNSYQFQ